MVQLNTVNCIACCIYRSFEALHSLKSKNKQTNNNNKTDLEPKLKESKREFPVNLSNPPFNCHLKSMLPFQSSLWTNPNFLTTLIRIAYYISHWILSFAFFKMVPKECVKENI